MLAHFVYIYSRSIRQKLVFKISFSLHKEISSLKLKSGFHTEQWGLATVYVRTINLLIQNLSLEQMVLKSAV